jgi:hypothetical protein
MVHIKSCQRLSFAFFRAPLQYDCGGRRAFTFKALGGKIGDSICEDDKQELALEILRLAKEKEFKFISP